MRLTKFTNEPFSTMKFAGSPSLSDSQLPKPGGSTGLMPNAPFVRLKFVLRSISALIPSASPLQRGLVDDLPEAERDDREVVATQPQRRQADQHARDRRRDARRRRGRSRSRCGCRRRPAAHRCLRTRSRCRSDGEVRRREPGGRVGADRIEGDVPEVEQARVAHDHVQADRHHREDDDRDHRVHVRECLEDRNLEQGVGPGQLVRPEDRVGDGECQHRQRQRDPPDTGRHQIEDVDDREKCDERRMWRHARQPREPEHEGGDHEWRHRALQERRLRSQRVRASLTPTASSARQSLLDATSHVQPRHVSLPRASARRAGPRAGRRG